MQPPLEKGSDEKKRRVKPVHLRGLTKGHVAVKLLGEGGDTDLTEKFDGGLALHTAVAQGNGGIVQMLLDKGADVNLPNLTQGNHARRGHTPLHTAIQLRDMPMVQLLLDRGADMRAKASSGQAPEDLARFWYGGHARVVAMMREVARRRMLARCEAVGMGHHERLGATSLFRGLDAGVLRMILDLV